MILSDAQYEQVKKAAGLVPLSAWFRDLGLCATDQPAAQRPMLAAYREAIKLPDVTFSAAPPSDRQAGYSKLVDGRTKRTCKHGIERGYNCWQCGGLAVIE